MQTIHTATTDIGEQDNEQHMSLAAAINVQASAPSPVSKHLVGHVWLEGGVLILQVLRFPHWNTTKINDKLNMKGVWTKAFFKIISQTNRLNTIPK